jgi:hypothetical protein
LLGKEFSAKIQIAFKESLETAFWLCLLHDTGYIDAPSFESLRADNEERIRILSFITKALREKCASVHEPFDHDVYVPSLSSVSSPTPNS